MLSAIHSMPMGGLLCSMVSAIKSGEGPAIISADDEEKGRNDQKTMLKVSKNQTRLGTEYTHQNW